MQKTQDYLVRSQLALIAVRLDRQKFNDAVSKGFYPCAPGTTQGRGRFFNMCELLVLWVFARLLDLGLSARVAGAMAVDIAAKINKTKASRVTFHFMSESPRACITDAEEDDFMSRIAESGDAVEYSISFNLSVIHKNLQHTIMKMTSEIG